MLYDAYQAQCDALLPVRLFADTARSLLDHPWLGGSPLVRGASAALSLFSGTRISHDRPEFGIDRVIVDGAEVAITEEAVETHPFCRLVHFRKAVQLDQPKLLVVAPLSGHFATLLRGTVGDRIAGPRRLSDRLGQRPQRAGRARPLRSRRHGRADRRLHPPARAGLPRHGGVPALGAGAGGGVADGGGGRCLPARLDGADGRTDRPGREPDRGQPLRPVAFARLVRARGDHHRAGALPRRVPPGLSRVSAARRVSQHEPRPPCRGALADVPPARRGRRRQRGGDPRLLRRIQHGHGSAGRFLPADRRAGVPAPGSGARPLPGARRARSIPARSSKPR